ncbi:trimethylamine-N-oxide reductase TorA [Photobacterium leiognathi]|uniref:trimethylamine-N-oxide reductase TorA n=1 Tax=Photobacterium leiognathi TaxID=553611 RepID=UPI001EE00596|nr:trimethylamine-N-oxide reductase TorA [Photobacterium leiognathi]MCG3883924.1 trimethylamine-N-oxide reductase TorA [Photobacterium leiognathi]
MIKDNQQINEPAWSRRRFLKGAAAIGGVSLMSTLLPKTALAKAIEQALPQFVYTKTAQDGILTSAHWGAFQAIVKDGKMVDVVPVADDPYPNELIKMAPHQVHAKNRIKYPMVRKSYLEGGPGAGKDKRGNDEWVRVSWDKANQLVANEITRLQTQYGPSSIYAGSYGWKSTGMFHNSRTLLQRLMNLNGGFLGYAGDYSTGAAQMIMPHVMGSMEVYEQQTTWPVIIESSELVVLWGFNAMVTLKNAWNVPDHEGQVGLQALKEKGTRIIAIDPVRNETVDFMDAEWIAPRPYTDVAMMLGIAHTLYTEELYDKEFLEHYTKGFDKFVPYLTGESDGTPKTAEWAAEISGIDAKTIKMLAHEFAKNRTMLMAGWGMQRQQHGEQPHWMMVTLAAMLGQIGLPGGGFGFSYHYSSGGSPTAKGGIISGINAGKAPKGSPAPIPVARIAEAILEPGKTIQFSGKSVTYPEIKMVYVAGGNPFHQHQDTNNLLKAWQTLDTIVVNEPYWTASAKHADIVLPTTTSYERNDIDMGGDYSQRYVFPMHKAVEPQFESKSDFDIFSGIAEKLGVKAAFTENKTEMQWIKGMYDEMAKQARANRVPLPPFSMFWEANDYITFPIPDANKKWIRHADFRENPLLNPLGTPSGRIEIYSDTVEKMGYADCAPHAKWYEPKEWYKAEIAKKYPLSLNTAHPTNRLHSQLDNTPLRDKYAVANREAILINANDAKARGIADGDLVRAFNDRGQILVGAKISDAIRPGVIRVSEGAWYDSATPGKEGGLCRNGCINVLTFDVGSSQLAQGNCGHMAQLEIEKYQGKAPENTAHALPRGA